MKKMVVLMAVLFLALSAVNAAAIEGQCVSCHTMHNSEQGSPVDPDGPNFNLLRYDCLGCHAQTPTGGAETWTLDGNVIPQVMHGGDTDLAGGNFNQADSRKIHNVGDLVAASLVDAVPLGEVVNDAPPGIPYSSYHGPVFTESTTAAFDMFTCAGARGCHGTRSQVVYAATVDNGTANNWEIGQRRTGMAALSGAHHANASGTRDSVGYNGTASAHSGSVVAAGYRFIPGLFGIEAADWKNTDAANHNEYYGNAVGFGSGCGACHIQDEAQSNTRAAFESLIDSPNNSMSGFCSTCHGTFHSSGIFGADFQNNGVSGAFLRHPSDYVIPSTGEYGDYIGADYNMSALVARPDLTAIADTSLVAAGDMVMCLSCHVAHGSENDYLLRFNYNAAGTEILAGTYADSATAAGKGGCLACHSAKGVTAAP